MSFRIMSAGKCVFAALTISLTGTEARDGAHLIPVEPMFGSNEPYANTYSKLVEEKLFTGSDWLIRYHFVSKAEIGLSITKGQNGRSLLTVKQAKPTLEYVTTNAYRKFLKWSLKSALKSVQFHEAHAELPESTVTAIQGFWISLLSDVRPRPAVSGDKTLVLGVKVTLSARTTDGKILQGELPADADKDRRLHTVEEIFEDLISISERPNSAHEHLFERIERRIQSAGR
jgi:hypothetical protein